MLCFAELSLVYDSLTQISIDSSETRVAPRYGLQVQADSSWPRRCIAGARRREEPPDVAMVSAGVGMN